MKKLLVCVSFLCIGHWTVIVYCHLVPVAGYNVTVDTVVAGRYLAPREPLPCGVGNTDYTCVARYFEGGFGFLVPVEVLCLACPEFLWVAQAFEENLILEMRKLKHSGSDNYASQF